MIRHLARLFRLRSRPGLSYGNSSVVERETMKAVKITVGSVLLMALFIEGLLRAADPWGAIRYFSDLAALYRHFREDVRGYAIEPGDYTFTGWFSVILPDGTRYTPDTHNAICTIALVGDSVTFGWGVGDSSTWANLLAREMPDVRILNMGVPAYNVNNVALSIARSHADGYMYLLINNDNEPELRWRDASQLPQWGGIQTYFSVMQSSARVPQIIPGAMETIGAIAADKRVRIVAFDIPGLGRDAAARYPVTLIRPYTGRISRADTHANAEGNREIAESMLPIIRELYSQVCTEVF